MCSFGMCQAHCKLAEMREIATAKQCTRVRNGSSSGKPKFGSDGLRRLREVWHGTWVSKAAVATPKPLHLADVTSLTHLELRGRDQG